MSYISSAPVTTGSYSAAVLDLLGAANDPDVASRAVNGEAIAPSTVAATGNISGPALYVTATGAGTETAGLTNGASDVNFRFAIKNGSGTTADSEQAWVGLTYAGDRKAGLSFWRGGGTDGSIMVFSTGINTEIMRLTNGAGADLKVGLTLSNGTTAAPLTIYNTISGANSESGVFKFGSNVLKIGTENAGTGAARGIDFLIGGTAKLTINNLGYIIPVLPTSAAGLPTGALWNDGGTVKIA